MAEATFVFEDADGTLYAVLPDAVTREDHSISASATEQEVGRGIVVTDHVRSDPDRFGCEIVISDSPIRSIVGDPAHLAFPVFGENQSLSLEAPDGPTVDQLAHVDPDGTARGVTLATGPAPIPSSATTFQADAEIITRTTDNWAILRAARTNAWLCTITTTLHTYTDMLLLSAEVVKTVADGTWIRVECLFRQLRRVSTQLVQAAEPLFPRDRPQANDGSQPTTETEPRPELRSVLTRVFG